MFRKAQKSSAPKSWPGRIWRFCWKGALWFFAITVLWVVLYRWIDPPTTYLHLKEGWNCPEGSSFSKTWVDGDQISLNMKLAVVASEDNNFMKHHGIDWGAVEKAKKYNATIGKKKGKMRGASTISQQVAKNVFLWPSRSWIRKGLEVYFTYLIEFFWSKERIMEVYLNVIETGPCKFGVEAAAQDYFHTSAAKLTRDQAALIAASLPNPKRYIAGKPGSYLLRRQGQITRLMRMIGDNYFARYSNDWPEEKRVKEEAEMEKKIEAIPEDERPVQEEIPVVEDPPSSPDTIPDVGKGDLQPAVEEEQADTSGGAH